jgi:Skp family chaperone for outer membrane proteins
MKTFLIVASSALVGSILSLTLTGHAQSAKTPSPVAFISSNRVIGESTYGRSEFAKIQALQQQRNTELRAKQQALEATRQELAAMANGAARIELQKKELQQRTEFERATQQAQGDVQTLQRQLNTALQQRLKTVLDDLMKAQNYQLVLNSDTSILWSTPELDLTNAVVGKLNAQQ